MSNQTADLPPGTTTNDIPDARCPFDCGLSLKTWNEQDPDGFGEAIIEAFEGEWEEYVTQCFCHSLPGGGGTLPPMPDTVKRRMDAALDRQVARQWVRDWMER